MRGTRISCRQVGAHAMSIVADPVLVTAQQPGAFYAVGWERAFSSASRTVGQFVGGPAVAGMLAPASPTWPAPA